MKDQNMRLIIGMCNNLENTHLIETANLRDDQHLIESIKSYQLDFFFFSINVNIVYVLGKAIIQLCKIEKMYKYKVCKS